MKGLWKENLGGWNAKGGKRKKQTRKQTLKDSYDYLSKTPDDRLEADGILVYDKKFLLINEYKESEAIFLRVFKIRVSNGRYAWTSTSAYDAYQQTDYYGKVWWRCSKTHEWICAADKKSKYDYKDVEVIREVETLVIRNDDPKWYSTFSEFTGDAEFYYGKELGFQGKWWRRGNPRKKYWSNYSNRVERRNSFDYCKKGDWDTEVQKGHYSKSIAWILV